MSRLIKHIPDGWRVVELGDACHTNGEYGINAAAVEYSDDLPTYLRITDIDEDGNFLNLGKKSVSDPNYEKFILERGDVVFARTGATVGKTYLYDEKDGELVFAGFLIRFKPKHKVLDSYFLKLFTSTNIYWNWVKLMSMRSGQPGINAQEYSSLRIPLPPFPEQQRIAVILSKWDELIETQTQLIEEKEKQKRGLMQKLLTGEVRFPGFEEEWEEKTIAEFGLVQTGNTPSRKELSYWGGDYNWTTADDMDNKYVVSSLQKLTKLGFEKARVAKKGSVLVTCIASIGKNAITKVDTGFNQQINSITVNEDFSSEFIYYLIDSQPNKLLEFAGAGAIPMLNKSNFMKIKYLVPNLKEQSKIALVLSSVDDEMQSLKEKLESIKLQKKGLMQQLLTGRIRVKV